MDAALYRSSVLGKRRAEDEPDAYPSRPSPTLHFQGSLEAQWKKKLNEYFGDDLLADGIGFRCWEDWSGLIREEDHYAWGDFLREYGGNCMAVSTRALQKRRLSYGAW